MGEQPTDSLAALVERARAAIAGAPVDVPDGPLRASSGDGLVTAEVGADGRVTAITLDPKIMRRPSQEIAEAVRTTVNDALDLRPAAPPTGPILEELKAVQEQSVREMSRISQAFTDALAAARRS